jgi:hypothetical protein
MKPAILARCFIRPNSGTDNPARDTPKFFRAAKIISSILCTSATYVSTTKRGMRSA